MNIKLSTKLQKMRTEDHGGAEYGYVYGWSDAIREIEDFMHKKNGELKNKYK